MKEKKDMVIQGDKVTLRFATKHDKPMIYEWLAKSDVTRSMMGSPNYPEHPIPTWEEFCTDYKPYYFDGSLPKRGRCFIILVNGNPVGQINYNEIDKRCQRTELDIWMKSESNCGQGYGSDTLRTLCKYLFQTYNVTEFVIRPSARNIRAIRAYEKADFHRINLSRNQEEAEYGPGEYNDSVVLIKHL